MTTTDERLGQVEGRLSRLEGGYEHLATKADLASIKAEVQLLKCGTGLLVIMNAGVLAALVRLLIQA